MQKTENDFTVVCFGMSQQGKSSFINEVAGKVLAAVGDGRRIETTRSVSTYKATVKGVNFFMTDVVGLNGSHLRFSN